MKKKFLSLVLACSLTIGSVPYATYADDIVTNDVPQVVTTEGETVTIPTLYYGVAKGPAFTSADYEHAVEFKDGSIFEIDSANSGSFGNGYLLVYTKNDDKITIKKSFDKRFNYNATPTISAWADGLMKLDANTDYWDLATDTTKSANTFKTDENTQVYLLEYVSETYKYNKGALTDISKGDFIGVPIVGADGNADLVIVYDYTKNVPATGITLDKTSLTLAADPNGENDKAKAVLTATVTPVDYTGNINWTSSNEDVAMVYGQNDGTAVVYGLTDGAATITASINGKTATCEVTVGNGAVIPVESITLSKTEMEITLDSWASLTVTDITPSNATNQTVSWTSSNPNVATVKTGLATMTAFDAKIEPNAVGTTTITATVGGKTATCVVKVLAKQYGVVSEVSDEIGSETIKIAGDSKTYNYVNESTARPVSGDLIRYTISGDKLTVYAGYHNDDIETLFKEAEWEGKFLEIDGDMVVLNSNVVVYRLDSNGKFVLGSKADIVDGSYVYAAVKNTVNEVTLLIADEYNHAKPTPAKSITLEKTSLKLAPNEGFELHYTLNPTNSTDSVTWTSSNESVVTVRAQGNPSYGWVNAVAEGTATLTATTGSGKTATCVVTVAPHLADFVVTVNGKDTGYDSFAEAWAAAIAISGSTLTLNEDVSLTGDTLEVANTTITINAKDSYTTFEPANTGFTGKVDGEDEWPGYRLFRVSKGGTLNLGGNLWITGNDDSDSGVVNVNGGTLNINGAKICSNSGTALSIENGGTVTMNSGKLYQNDSNYKYAVWIDDGTFNIKDGEVACDWNQYTQLIMVQNGTVNMSAGEVQQIYLDKNYDEDAVAKAIVSGGTLGSLIFDDNEYGKGTQSATITGGTFDFDPTDYVPTSGYTITQNSLYGGSLYTWTVTKKSSGGGGGGGSSSNKKDDTTKTDTKTDEVKTDEVKTEEKTETTAPAVAPGEATTENISQVFPDTKSDDWYSEAAAYAYNNGLMKGNGDGSFGANDSATRGQIVTILHRLANEPETSTSDFKDIGGSEYYAEGVAWAAELGIVNGYEDGTFGANGNVTREELATILYRFAKSQDKLGDKKGDLSGFADGGAASDWAADALAWAVGNGLLQGNDDGSLNPSGTATRAEIATILMRFCENIAK